MLLSTIIRRCPQLKEIHFICSDSWYSYGVWGQYFFLKSEKKIYLPNRSRVFAVQDRG